MQKYADTRHVIYIMHNTVQCCSASNEESAGAYTPNRSRIEKMATNISTKMATKMATVPQFLHWEARPDFKEQTCQTKKQVWQHQHATKFGLSDYSTRSRGRVQRGRLNKGPKWLKASKNSVIPWKCLQFPHHKISSSHIEQEHSWEMLVTKSQNHPFCANLILRVFSVFSPGFHGFFIAFSKFFTVSLFSQISKVRLQFFKHGISVGVGPSSA